MKFKAGLFLFLLVALAFRSDAAMSESRALADARTLYGLKAGTGHARAYGDTYETKMILVYSPACRETWTALGRGLNTWEAAFAAVPADIVIGPVSGTVSLEHKAYDNTGIVGFQWKLDGVSLGAEIAYSPSLSEVSPVLSWNTASTSNGVHVLCAQARDAAGNVEKSRAILVQTNQAEASITDTLDFNTSDGSPSIP
jgi:hypothetical protein